MDAPHEEFYTEARRETLVVLFKIITRESRRELPGKASCQPGSGIEHIEHGIFALVIAPGGASRPTTKDEGR